MAVFNVRPVLLQNHMRIEALLIIYFLVLLVESLIERDIARKPRRVGRGALLQAIPCLADELGITGVRYPKKRSEKLRCRQSGVQSRTSAILIRGLIGYPFRNICYLFRRICSLDKTLTEVVGALSDSFSNPDAVGIVLPCGERYTM